MVKPSRFVDELEPYRITPQDVWSESAPGDLLKLDWNEAPHDLELYRQELRRILDERGHLRTLEQIERDLIQHAIEVYAGHMSEIARRLGIGRSTLYRKVREQGREGILKEAG